MVVWRRNSIGVGLDREIAGLWLILLSGWVTVCGQATQPSRLLGIIKSQHQGQLSLPTLYKRDR